MAAALILTLVAATLPAVAIAGSLGARIEGRVLGVDGRPAAGHRVHLIDDGGRSVAQAATSNEGIYAFKDLAAGSYGLGIEGVNGEAAPVAAPAVKLGNGELGRRDIRLMQAEPGRIEAATQANYGVGMWWAGLSPAAKVWTIIGIVAVAGVTAAALSDDDESDASPSEPED
jgi:hypothetical protein